jgi:DNA-binding MarR family transcriptional regulator
MHKKLKRSTKLESLDAKMTVIKDFIDVFYDETVFRHGKINAADFSPSFIKALFSFRDPNEEYPIGELGENARVKRSTMTDMVDRLERDGIAERVRDTGDRRVVKVRLTNKGKRIRSEFSRKRRQEFQVIFSELEEEDTLHLIFHLDEAAKILRKIH